MGTDFTSNRAAWLVAGFLGRKVMKDMLGRWSLIPVLAVGLCLWTKWKTRQQEEQAERDKLEEMRRAARLQLLTLHQKSSTLKGPPPHGGTTGHTSIATRGSSIFSSPFLAAGNTSNKSTTSSKNGHVSPEGRQPGDRLGGIPSSSIAVSALKHLASKTVSPTRAAGSSVAAGKDTALATSEWWAWFGVGGGAGRGGNVCGADRGSRSRGGSGGGEWRGAFTNRMGGIPRRNAFKTARGKVYLRSGNRRPGGGRQSDAPTIGGLESVREEDEGLTL